MLDFVGSPCSKADEQNVVFKSVTVPPILETKLPMFGLNATPKNIIREVYRYRMMAAFQKMIDAIQLKPLVGAILQWNNLRNRWW